MGRKLKRALTLAMTAVMTAIAALPAYAAPAAGEDLSIVYKTSDTPISGAEFRAYKITDMSYVYEDKFAGCGVELNNNLDNSEWTDAAERILAYIDKNSIQPSGEGKTDESGELVIKNLEEGVYLVDGDPVKIGRITYTPLPFWMGITADAEASAEPKYEEKEDPAGELVTGNLEVCKRVAGSGASEKDMFAFRVTLSGTYIKDGETLDASSINGVYGEMKFKKGVASFRLKHGEAVTAADLPARLSFKVEETKAKDYVVSYQGAEGIIPDKSTARVEILNTKEDPTPIPETPTPELTPAISGTPAVDREQVLVDTGDNSMLGMWISLFALCVITAVVVMRKRNK